MSAGGRTRHNIGKVSRAGTYFASIGGVGLHLHALPQIHERLVDLARFRQRCPSRLRISRALRAWNTVSTVCSPTFWNLLPWETTYPPGPQPLVCYCSTKRRSPSASSSPRCRRSHGSAN